MEFEVQGSGFRDLGLGCAVRPPLTCMAERSPVVRGPSRVGHWGLGFGVYFCVVWFVFGFCRVSGFGFGFCRV